MATRIAVGTRMGYCYLYNTNTLQGNAIKICESISKVQFAKDKSVIYVAGDNRLYQIPESQFTVGDVTGFGFETDDIYDFCVHPVQPELYSVSGSGTVRMYDLRTLQPFHTFELVDRLHSIGLLPSQDYILSGNDQGGIQLWNKRSGILQHQYHVDNSIISAINVEPRDDAFCCGTMSGNIITFDLENGKYIPVRKINAYDNDAGVISCALSEESESLIAASITGEISEWDSDGDNPLWRHSLYEEMLCCEVSRDRSRAYAGFGDGRIANVNLQNGRHKIEIDLQGGPVQTISVWE